MKKFIMAAVGGTLAGVIMTTQVAAPLLAQEADKKVNVYEQLDLFGDIFERIRAQYVEEVDEGDLIEALASKSRRKKALSKSSLLLMAHQPMRRASKPAISSRMLMAKAS